jgi:hypothetical protein
MIKMNINSGNATMQCERDSDFGSRKSAGLK